MERKASRHHSRQLAALVIGVVTALLVLHTFFGDEVRVDNTTVLLLVVIVLVPYLPWITRIKFGDFEAEIGREEIKEIEKNLKASGSQPSTRPPADEELETVREISHSDSPVAFLKIRIAIEKRLRMLTDIYDPDRKDRTYQGVNAMVANLVRKEVIDRQLAEALRSVTAVVNRAVHGENIQSDNVDEIIDLSFRAIYSLDGLVIERALNTMKTKIIEQEAVEAKRNAEYEVETIAPYVQNPEKRTYAMNQAELAAFLEGYDEYAEFLVSLKESKKPVDRL